MKRQTKIIIYSLAMCFIAMVCVFSVLAVKNFSLVSGGVIEFVAPGVDATISDATLTGVSKKADSATMSTFTVKSSMSTSQIEALDGYKTWNGIKLLFDDESEGNATISFTITNNSSKAIENIMVELSTNTTSQDSIQATPSADFCINPGDSHTFSVDLSVVDTSNSSMLNNFALTVALRLVKDSDVVSTTDYSAQGLTFETSKTDTTAILKKCTQPTSAASAFNSGFEVNIPNLIEKDGKIYTVTEIYDTTDFTGSVFYNVKSSLTSVSFPSTLTKIGGYAFNSVSNLAGDLIIPDSVKEIGEWAFAYCSKLTSLQLGRSLEHIYSRAFYDCKLIAGEIVLPYNLKTISSYAFSNCTAITSLVFENCAVELGESAFSNCSKIAGELIISKRAVSIGNYAFSGCKLLTKITIEEGLETIGDYAFNSCTGLTGDLIIPNSVKSIGNSAFFSSVFNGRLSIGKNVSSIGENAFANSNNLSEIIVDESNSTYFSEGNCLIEKTTNKILKGCNNSTLPTDLNLNIIGGYAFYKCSNLKWQLSFLEDVTEIKPYAFANCTGLTGDLTIPQGVTTIGDYAFNGCSGLDGELTIPNSVTSIGKWAFGGCNKLTGELALPSGLTAIAERAFSSCSKLSGDLVIPGGVENVGQSAFAYCYGITSATVSEGVKTMGGGVFESCYNMQSVSLPDSLTTVGELFFTNCSSLTTVTVPKNLSKIGQGFLLDCTKLTSIIVDPANTYYHSAGNCLIETAKGHIVSGCETSVIPTDGTIKSIGMQSFTSINALKVLVIPSSVTKIEDYAFTYCRNLESITIEATTPPTLGSLVFQTSSCPIYVPAESVDAYKTATNWRSFSSRIQAIPA